MRIGWKFTPRGRAAQTDYESINGTWNLVAPSRLCHPGEAEKCSEGGPSKAAKGGRQGSRPGPQVDDGQALTLGRAYQEAVDRYWKSRWLLLKAGTPFGAGTWQCWIEGLDLFQNTTADMRSKTVSYLTT